MGKLNPQQMVLKTIIVGVLLGLTSCSYYALSPNVDTRTEIQYAYKTNKDYKRSKWRKSNQKIGYERYDKRGNIIEEGKYGEIWHIKNFTKNPDSSTTVTIGHGQNYKNLNTVHYYIYDNTGKKIQDELWQFKSNKKSFLIHKTIFEYDLNGKLVRETEYDNDNKVLRVQDYSKDSSNQTILKNNIFNRSNEGITKAEDKTITDSLGRPIEKIHYYKGKFLYKQEFRYDSWGNIVTELRYDNKPDSLWCITEWQYNHNKQPIQKLQKVIGSNTETKDVYIYNRKKLLVKVLHYSGKELDGYTKYKYTLYK